MIEIEPLVGDQQRLHVVPAVRFDRIDVVWVVLANAPRPDPRSGLEGPAVPHWVPVRADPGWGTFLLDTVETLIPAP